ncbi:unnamed protein product [Closterium sp. Yama58-4]|nr:unnamed protein product [Closterium sp. Yama58-4]
MALTTADAGPIYNLLEAALNEATRKEAEQALNAYETRVGFCSCLLEIISRKELDQKGGARWLAAVYFKNSINRYWRARRETQGISDEEKPALRARLLDLVADENSQVAVQLAVLIAKIARIDYPREWSELFPTLLQKLQTQDPLLTQRTYLVLNHVLKELSTKRLSVDQRTFAQVTSQLFEPTWAHWVRDTGSLLQGLSALESGGSDPAAAAGAGAAGGALMLLCERWLLCVKTLRRMLVFGFPSDFKSVQARGSGTGTSCARVSRSSAIAPQLPEYLPAAPSPATPAHLPLPRGSQAPQNAPYKQNPTGHVVGAAVASAEEMRGKLSGMARHQLQSFFTQEKVVTLGGVLVQRYLVLTAADLEEWGSDPEVFYHEQGAVQWKDKLRPCAEALLLLLFEQFKEVLSPALIDMLRQCMEACPPPASPDADVPVTPALLLKDACYDAVGVACYDLHDVVDFKTWFTTALLPDMACRHPNARILRRRAAWMVGQWVGKVEGELCVPAYQALISLLPDEDLVVQLTAVSSLRTLIDDVHFYEDQFAPFLDTAVQLLFRCLQQVSEFDSQLQIVNVVSLIIERMGEKIVPLADKILSCLPQVWEQSEGQPLLRIQVMQALQRLIVSLGPQSPISYPLLFPILRYSTDISQPDELNMLEDGLQLWQATLRHAPAMVPELMALFSNLVPIMDRSFEHLPVATAIMESYVLVGGPAFLQQHAGSLVSMIDAVVGNVKEKAMLLVAGLVDLIIQCYPAEAPPALESVLQKLLLIIVGPTEYSDLVRGTCATVLARVVLQNSSYFAQFISANSTRLLLQQQSAAKGNAPPLALFLDAWLDKVDSVSVPAKRKLSTLALAVLLTMPEPQILERLDLILSVCTGSLGDDNPDNTPLLPDISTVG